LVLIAGKPVGRGTHNDRSALSGPVANNGPRGLQAVHVGHLHIHEDQIVGLFPEKRESLSSVPSHISGIPHLPQDEKHELLVHRIVFGHENP